MPLKRWLPWKL